MVVIGIELLEDEKAILFLRKLFKSFYIMKKEEKVTGLWRNILIMAFVKFKISANKILRQHCFYVIIN